MARRKGAIRKTYLTAEISLKTIDLLECQKHSLDSAVEEGIIDQKNPTIFN